jgi:thiosulfate reductase cytochrome b subunit/cytochrome c553
MNSPGILKMKSVVNTGLMFLLVFLVAGGNALANEFHPVFPLLDKAGRAVIESGEPLSTMTTCGGCHNTSFIASSSDHADAGAQQLGSEGSRHEWQAGPGYFGDWDPLRYDSALTEEGRIDIEAWLKQSGARHVGGGPVAELIEMDCLLCHSDLTDPTARRQSLQRGDYAWANSSGLSQTDILLDSEGQWLWNPDKFQADGSLVEGVLSIRKPTDENCAQCHGIVDRQLDIPLTVSSDLATRSMSDRTGQIISPQKVFNSGMNIAGKDSLAHAFDVHADRVVGCVNCHYSLNNPVYFQQREESRPLHLDFDPRRLSSADYLQRPLHQFAKGKSTHGLAAAGSENSLRRCESCHDAGKVHQWLPYRERHFSSLACESCHIPNLYGPALQTLDWTLPDRDGQPRRRYRNVEGDPASADGLFHGFRPVILARENVSGVHKLSPYNLVTSWYWLAGNPARPVSREQLVNALYQGDEWHADLLRALDDDGDGRLTGSELNLDSEERATAVRERLQESGLDNVQLSSEITPFSISHNVVNGRWATRECSSCHDKDSLFATAFTLSDYRAGGQLPAHNNTADSYAGLNLDGEIIGRDDGSVAYIPDSSASGFYIIGLNSLDLVDKLGLLMFFGVSMGVSGHALARYYFRRRRLRLQNGAQPDTRPVYMYDRYERLWHWLQASAILILLATGLIIHKPHIFGIFSFAYVVQVHNVLGFILLINAALALFYNLASGEIRQYLPEPKGFIGRSMAQTLYYTRGIFAGEAHPLEKTKERKLNPLQQITYLAILNILLPAQVITGVLIWGLQRWPQLTTSLGGLPVLAPIHTLVAWAFSAFIVMHVYLTTAAGETLAAGIKSMVSGWEHMAHHEHAPENEHKES